MVRCDIILDRFHHNYKIATAFTFISVNIMADVKSCVYIFFTTGNIETRCKTYSIFPFTSDIFSTDVKSLLIGQICSSDITLGIKIVYSKHNFNRNKIKNHIN
jgi:hypothetical protein